MRKAKSRELIGHRTEIKAQIPEHSILVSYFQHSLIADNSSGLHKAVFNSTTFAGTEV
jgi:hypothetical protein